MQLLFVHSDDVWSGRTRVFVTVAHALAARGYSTALALPADSDVARIARKSQAKVLELPPRRSARVDAKALAEHVTQQRSDTVFVHGDYDHVCVAKALKRAGRGALVRRVAAGETASTSRAARRAAQLYPVRLLYTSETPPTGHAAPSGSLTPLRAELGVPVPDARTGAVADGYALLACVATREALRRATNVVRAAALLSQQHPALRLRVIGSAASDPDLQVLASALGLGRRVEWVTHATSASDVLEGVSAGWVVADGDDAGLGVLHLMAHGIVPLAERTPVTLRYVTAGVQGILLAQLDPPAMAAETTALLADRARRETMGAAGRSRVEREFTLRDMLAGFEQAARASRDRRTPS